MPSSRANPDSFGSAPGSLHSSAMAPAAGAGDTLAERYRLDREGVRTEAGVLFDALDLDLNRRVAVEIASSIEEPKARRKWARDATLAQRLEGAHVLRVLDVGDVDGVPYAVRDATLCTMAAEIEVKDAVPIPLAVAWTLEACEAVAEAHALGMAHGDLRLDNIYLVRGTTEPTVKVAWTSAAKAERAAKEDIARDLAGLGVLLRVLATGRFGDDEADGAPTLPTELAHAVARALAVAFLMSRAGIVSGTIPGSPPSSRRPTRRARPAFAFVSAALIALVLGGSWFLWQNGKLPRWTGAAPPDAIGNTEVTSAPAAAVEPAAVEPTAVEPTNAAPATGTSTTTTTPLPTKRHAVEPKANSGAELRYADPPTTPTPATPTPVTTTPSTAAPAPLDEPTPSTVSAPAAPTTTAPAPELVPSETQPASPTTD
jgi:cell division septation protein DedD